MKENEKNIEQCQSKEQVCEPDISLCNLELEIDHSPRHEDSGHVQPCDKEDKSNMEEAHGKRKHKHQMSSDHNTEGRDPLSSTYDTDETLSKPLDTIDPSDHFLKVTADFRESTKFTTLMGLKHMGEIARYIPNRKKQPFYVLYEYDQYDQYVPQYSMAMESLNRFEDQKREDYWKSDIQELCKHWEIYSKNVQLNTYAY